MTAITQNQLLFNLDVPTMPVNMAAHFPKPEAIVIEKFGPCSGPVITAPKPVFRLSCVSEESLSQALQLAKRDMKKQKENQLTKSEKLGKSTRKVTNKGVKKGHTEIIRSQHYTERLRKREERKKQEKNQVLLMKEREKGWKSRTMTTQTSCYGSQINTDIAGQRKWSDLPVYSMSPPTRDMGQDLSHLSREARILAEIQKLRKDIDESLSKIHQVYETVKRNPSAWKQETPRYAEDIEAERKRILRREEQETRSLRTIYQLTQHVRMLQDEVKRIGPANIKHEKKNQILSRLAAVHRGSVRALQTFIQHLTDYDITQGLPRSYHEIGVLLRHLSLCCIQLEVTKEAGIPENVLVLIKEYAEINKILDLDMSLKSPPRLCQVKKKVQNTKKRSPISRKLDFNVASNSVGLDQKSDTSTKMTNNRSVQGPVIIDKVPKETADRGITTDCQTALRAGITALMRAASPARGSSELPQQISKSAIPHLELNEAFRTPRGVAWEYPLEKHKLQQFKAGPRKGLLLPAKLRDERRNVLKPSVALPGDTHYAKPTVSSHLKEVPPEERLFHQLALNSPQASRKILAHDTARCQSGSPRSPKPSGRSHTPSLSSSPRSPRLSARSCISCDSPRVMRKATDMSPFGTPARRRDIINQVQIERENTLKRKEREKIDKLRRTLGQPEEWVQKAEAKIRERLRPILDQAQVNIDVDLLADNLLGELLEESVRECQDIETDKLAEIEAATILNMPSVNTMITRLQEMEAEQQEIRCRWATLVYEEENSSILGRARYLDAPLSEQPSAPTPIHVISELPAITQTLLPDSVLASLESHPADERAILFTKPTKQAVSFSSLHLSHPDGAMLIKPKTAQMKPGVHISLSMEIIQSIESHKKAYEQYLRNNSYQAVGNFNPWLIVEEIASEIMDDCLFDIAKELDDINSGIVNQVYSGEFSKTPSVDSPKPTTTKQNQGSAFTNWKQKVPSEAETKREEMGQLSIAHSREQDTTLSTNAKSLSPEQISGNYSYEDDFVDSSARSRSHESVSESDHTRDT